MPTAQQTAFDKERRRQLGRLATITTATRERVLSALRTAQDVIRRRLAANASAFTQAQSAAALAGVRGALTRFERDGDAAWQQGVGQAFSAGGDLIEKPLQAGGIGIVSTVQRVDSRQLAAMRAFLTGRIKDISSEAARAIETQLALVIAGAQAPQDAINNIEQILGGNARGRAITITRTELGRAYALASYERMIAARQLVPGLRKQWRRSGKLKSRIQHDLVDGQIRDVDQSFDVGGEKLRFPRDPNASAVNTINCGCTMLPHMVKWDVATPGRKRFTPEEVAARPERGELNELIQRQDIKRFVAKPSIHPVAIGALDLVLRTRIGTQSHDVLLSSATLAKQSAHHPEIDVDDYAVVDALIATGEVYQIEPQVYAVYGRAKGKLYKAVVKLTKSGKANYLVSLRRANQSELRRDTRKGVRVQRMLEG
ncbi:MAG: hypothetical protein HYV17_08020 [Xanthomonadales bacterium]|nr:hypothetical protein [Xanthomonadales bacterium]